MVYPIFSHSIADSHDYYLQYILVNRPPKIFASSARLPAWHICRFDQWEFQDPEMEVPTIYKAYRVCKGISAQHMALYGTNVPPF